ncbi:MAG: nitroreductase family protein [Candidatus Aureabacteria bacterium]|nr:nitroreductase family protein [Candidatus Auribacterota bacterium]
MDAMEALRQRRSVRSFKKDPIPQPIVEAIIDAGRLAPTARNIQPWEFVVVRDAAMRARIAGHATTGPFIAEAPVCVAVFCKDTKYWLEDGCAAVENIIIAARAHGLGHCWVAGEKKPYAAAVGALLGAAPDIRLIALIAIGYPKADPPAAPKRALKEVLHWERF